MKGRRVAEQRCRINDPAAHHFVVRYARFVAWTCNSGNDALSPTFRF
jgi:hypothetical protein